MDLAHVKIDLTFFASVTFSLFISRGWRFIDCVRKIWKNKFCESIESRVLTRREESVDHFVNKKRIRLNQDSNRATQCLILDDLKIIFSINNWMKRLCMCFAWANADEIIIDLSDVRSWRSLWPMFYVHELRIARENNQIRDVSNLQHNSTELLSSRSTAIVLDTYVFDTVEKHPYRRLPIWYIYF